MPPKTLLELVKADVTPARIEDATLVLVDMQNEYCDGPISVEGLGPAVARARRLLDEARSVGAPVVHVAHKGKAGSMFDRATRRGAFIAELAPAEGEHIVEKGLPNSFAGTTLLSVLQSEGRNKLIVVGFMTHMCVSSTVRAALDQGYSVTVDAAACATRDLPDGKGGILPASVVHTVALAELADRFAVIRHTDIA